MTKEHAKEFVDRFVLDSTVAIIVVNKVDDLEFRSVLSDGSGKYYLDAEVMNPNQNVFDYVNNHTWNDRRDSVPGGLKRSELHTFFDSKFKPLCPKDG